MKYLPLFFVVALQAMAQNSPQYLDCNHGAKTQTELNACASEEAARVGTELQHLYRKLLSEAGSQQGAAGKIEAMERAWLAYRDAYIEAMYPEQDKLAAYGSIYPMEADLLSAKLTAQHTSAIRDLLRQYGENESSQKTGPNAKRSRVPSHKSQ